jgi:hypothetical protein
MRITETYVRKVVKEELKKVLNEIGVDAAPAPESAYVQSVQDEQDEQDKLSPQVSKLADKYGAALNVKQNGDKVTLSAKNDPSKTITFNASEFHEAYRKQRKMGQKLGKYVYSTQTYRDVSKAIASGQLGKEAKQIFDSNKTDDMVRTLTPLALLALLGLISVAPKPKLPDVSNIKSAMKSAFPGAKFKGQE